MSSIIKPHSLMRMRAGIGRVQSGTGNAKFLMVGDSLTVSAYSNNSAFGDWKTNSYPSHLTNFLNAQGISANRNSFMGGGDGSDYLHNPQLTVGSGWNPTASPTSIGGSTFVATSATSNLSWSPLTPVDTFLIHYVQNTPLGEFSYNVNGGTNTNVNCSGAGAFMTQTVSCALGINTLNLNWYSGSNGVVIVGVEAYNSAENSISIINAGWSGSQASMWAVDTSSPWDPYAAISTLAPDLICLCLGGNELLQNITLDGYQQNMEFLITSFLETSDVILITPNHVSPLTETPEIHQRNLRRVMHDIAEKYDLSIFDQGARLGSFDQQSQVGMSYSDNIHMIGPGYADNGWGLGRLLLSA